MRSIPFSMQRLAARIITKCWSNPQSRTHPILQERRWRQKAMICGRILKLYLPLISPITPISVCVFYPLVTPFAKTAAHQSSFLISSTRIWNSLPDHVVCAPSGFSILTPSRLPLITIFFMLLIFLSPFFSWA